jgi:Tol biopolymer transport system component
MEKLMVQDLRGGAPLTIFEFKTIRSFRWSPDGLTLLVNVRDDSTSYSYIIPRMGGESRSVHDVLPTSSFTWSSDGRQFVISGGIFNRIWFYDWQSGDTASITLHGDFSELNDIHCASSGERLLFKTKSQNLYKIWTIKTDGSQQKNVLLDSTKIKSPRWSPDGQAMYYLRENYQTNDLMKLNINPSTGYAEGEPVRVITALQGEEPISISKDNRKLLFWGINEISNLKLIQKEKSGYSEEMLTSGTAQVFWPRISPDGKRIAFSMGGDKQKSNIYVIPIDGGKPKQLTFFDSFNTIPAWSPDGKEIAFVSNEGGKYRIWTMTDKGGLLQPFENSRLSNFTSRIEWALTDEIIYQYSDVFNIHSLNPVIGIDQQIIDNDSQGIMFHPCYSPDKKKIIIYWIKDKTGLWLFSLSDSSQTCIKREERLTPITWSSDGKWVYIFSSRRRELLKINIDDGREELVLEVPSNEIYAWDLSMTPDEKIIVVKVVEVKSDVWLIENFDPYMHN